MRRLAFVLFACAVPLPVLADHTLAHTLGGLQDPVQPPADTVIEPDPAVCTAAAVFPMLATDGDELSMAAVDVAPGQPVLLRGYRYVDAPPTGSRPTGEGRQLIYCGCQRVTTVTAPGIDGQPDGLHPVIRVPRDAPSGHYSVEVLEPGSACSSGGIGTQCEEPTQCLRPSLTVAPAFITATLDRLVVDGNSEEKRAHPAELQFSYAAVSGVKPGQGNSVAEFNGAFPAGRSGRAHLTNSDFSALSLRLPLFSAAEDRLTAAECREECNAVGNDARVQACIATCNGSTGSFNDLIEIGLSGVERDSSGDTGWTKLAGIGASALACVAAGNCADSVSNSSTAVGLAEKVAGLLEAAIAEDDDALGAVGVTLRADVNDWGIDRPDEVVPFTGGESGTLGAQVASRRVPAPSILRAEVILESIRLNEGYERSEPQAVADCRGVNELSLQVQAYLGGGEQVTAPVRIPAGTAVLKAAEGDQITLDETVVRFHAPRTTQALEVPFVFVSVGVWEEDGGRQPDLIGYGADTHFIGDLVNFPGPSEQVFTPEGQRMRTIVARESFFVNGYDGSDNDCFPPLVAFPGTNAEQGQAEVRYRIELDWLVIPDHR